MGFTSVSQSVSDETLALERASRALRELGFQPIDGRFVRGSRVGSAIGLAPWHWQTEAELDPSDGRVAVAILPKTDGQQYLTREDCRYLVDEAHYVANAAEPAAKIRRPTYSRRKAIAQGLWILSKYLAVAVAGFPLALLQGGELAFAVSLFVGPVLALTAAFAGRYLVHAVAGRSQGRFARWARRWTHCTLYLGIQPDRLHYIWLESAEVRELAGSGSSSMTHHLAALAARDEVPSVPLWQRWRRRVLFVHASGFPDNIWSVEKRMALETLRTSWQPHELYLVPPELPIGEATAAGVGKALWAIRRELPSQRGPRSDVAQA